jgi:ribosomal-protein-alanine N-acetyltransferase
VLNLDWKPRTLETERLILRPLSESDVVDVFLYACNPNVTQHTLFNTHETLDDTLFFLRDYRLSRYANGEPDPLGIVLRDDPTHCVIGAMGCHWLSRPDGVMEMGYALAEPYWGRGLIAEAGRAMIACVFQEFAVERLQARIFDGNAASGRVAGKMGMKHEGTLRSYLLVKGKRRDVDVYSILRSEWAASPIAGTRSFTRFGSPFKKFFIRYLCTRYDAGYCP